jgi:hypothetical protein
MSKMLAGLPTPDLRPDVAFCPQKAVAFYGHLLEGKTVAEATRLARRSIRRAGDPMWLSYTVYANPLARLAVEAVA